MGFHRVLLFSPSWRSTHVSIGVCSTGKTSDVSFKLILIMISLYCQHWRWSSNCKVFKYTDFSKRTPNFLHFLMLFSITWDDEFLAVSHLGLHDSWESTPPLLPKGSPEKITLSLCLVQFWWFVKTKKKINRSRTSKLSYHSFSSHF